MLDNPHGRPQTSVKTFLQVEDQYYVLATSVLADHETRVLKQGETFAIFDSYGDVQPVTHQESGVYHRGTRHLSRFEFSICGEERPLLLNSTLRDDNGLLKVDMTNRDLDLPNFGFLPKGTLFVHREKFLLDAKCMEQVSIENYGHRPLRIGCSYRIGADFADIFEVRGLQRSARGQTEPMKTEGSSIKVFYRGLDGIRRATCLEVSVPNCTFENETVKFHLDVPARGRVQFDANLHFSNDHHDGIETDSLPYAQCFDRIIGDHTTGRGGYCSIETSNDQFDAWMRRSTDDLVMMTTTTDEGHLYPYAGIPWYCAAFGRDGILTAMECLWANPRMAKGVLEYLSSTQAQESNPAKDATPGKIIHEVRHGEMANLQEIPFGQYYGSVDSTPLFVCLAGAYLTRTNDLATVKKLWPAIEKAIFWIDRWGDIDGDGFIEYQRENQNGLVHQGWKDSQDCVFHEDGSDAKAPIALCEAQGYSYMARIEGARIAEAVGHRDLAADLRKKAAELKEKFDQAFWLEDLGTYALALDGDKRPCRVSSSNAGQCLFTGIVKKERAARLAKTLLSQEMFSGWGVRTVGTTASRYNPLSYHNGSVWPHDVALVAWGLAKYGLKTEVETIFNGLFRSALYMEDLRMPEVFCGFPRREGEAPTLYPHACAPQAWASGSIYLLVQAMLGISIDACQRKVYFHWPRLPESIDTIKISNLAVDDGTIDMMVQNYGDDVSVHIERRSPEIAVAIEK